MHELSEPTRYTPEPDETLTDDVFINARQHGSGSATRALSMVPGCRSHMRSSPPR